ncbi:MAG: glycosyltransferase [Candidatus Paceibacterota bacterium]
MRILIITTDLNVLEEGSEKQKQILKYGTMLEILHVIVFTKKKSDYSVKKIADNIWIYPTNSLTPINFIGDSIDIARINAVWKNRVQIDVVIGEDPFEAGFAAWQIARKSGRPLLLQVFTDFFTPKFYKKDFLNKIRFWFAKFILSKADCVAVFSESMKEKIILNKINLKNKIEIFPSYTDMDSINKGPSNFDIHKKYPQFNFILIINPHSYLKEELEFTIKILKEVVKKHPRVGAIFIGDNEKFNIIEKMLVENQLLMNVFIETNPVDVIPYYKTANAFFIPFTHEESESSLIEAVACGCPIVCCDSAITSKYVEDNVNGFVCNKDDDDCFKKSIINLLGNNMFRTQIRVNATGFVEEYISKKKEEYLQEIGNLWEKCRLMRK